MLPLMFRLLKLIFIGYIASSIQIYFSLRVTSSVTDFGVVFDKEFECLTLL